MSSRNVILLIVGILLIVSFSNVLGGKPGGTTPPVCTGAPIEVLVQSSCGANKWVKVTDSASVCEIMCTLTATRKNPCGYLFGWIGGRVIADVSAPNGWYFEPSTVQGADITAEGLQTNLCSINQNPTLFAGTPEVPNNIWWVAYNISQWRYAQ